MSLINDPIWQLIILGLTAFISFSVGRYKSFETRKLEHILNYCHRLLRWYIRSKTKMILKNST